MCLYSSKTLVYSFLVLSSSGFGIGVILASQNELGNVSLYFGGRFRKELFKYMVEFTIKAILPGLDLCQVLKFPVQCLVVDLFIFHFYLESVWEFVSFQSLSILSELSNLWHTVVHFILFSSLFL